MDAGAGRREAEHGTGIGDVGGHFPAAVETAVGEEALVAADETAGHQGSGKAHAALFPAYAGAVKGRPSPR